MTSRCSRFRPGIRRETKIRFECQQGCTNCCDQQGFVYLTEDDIARLAGFVGLSRGAFEKQYVFRTRNLRRLRVPLHAQCWFLKDGGCSVHPAKPVQCSAFPYWPELLKSARAWKTAGRYCPGIGKGALVNIELATKTSNAMRQAHPALYDQ